MKTTNKINDQALSLEEAQNEIRAVVKESLFLNKNVDKKIHGIIRKALSRIRIPSLRDAARRSLIRFYNMEKRIANNLSYDKVLLFLSLLRLEAPANPLVKHISEAKAIQIKEAGEFNARLLGVPMSKFSEDYFKENIKPTLERMAKEEALDPDAYSYWGKRSSLFNRAEREVRHEDHLKQLSGFRNEGVKLVIISSHADCSDRCRPFQGRVYSLDGTSGTAPDGRHFEPIETATDIYTKDGKWKNGLFGFNCRHYAVEYKDDYRFPTVPASVERKEYQITMRQREMERNIRKWKIRAEMMENVDRVEYMKAKSKANMWESEYRKFSRQNDRAYIPSRTKIK